jgi:hypothetical protein
VTAAERVIRWSTADARWLLGPGIAATLAANVAHGLGHGPVGAAVAAWPATALVGFYELLMTVIRSSQATPDGASGRAGIPIPDPLQGQAAELFPVIWRRTAFHRYARSARSFTSASHGRSDYGTTLQQERGAMSIPLHEQLAGRS